MKGGVPFSAALLAGGRSRRMGIDKALLEWRGQRLLDHQLEVLHSLGPAAVFLSQRAEVDYGVKDVEVVCDDFSDSGPLGGIASVLKRCSMPLLLVLAVDLPFVSAAFLQSLLERCRPGRGCVPRTPLGWEPLAGVYPRELATEAHSYLAIGQRSVQGFLDGAVAAGHIQAYPLESSAPILFNWNLPGTPPAD